MLASRSSPARPHLELVPPVEEQPRPHAIAVILPDGSVRALGDARAEAAPSGWASGSVAGQGWILWWDRRSF
jgi:hypothetical protein